MKAVMPGMGKMKTKKTSANPFFKGAGNSPPAFGRASKLSARKKRSMATRPI
jgi:hypothetical protein